MTWHAVYEIATGRLVSTGTVVADDADLAARGLARTALAFDPQIAGKRWNEGTRGFDDVVVPKPWLDRQTFLDRFTAAEREAIFTAVGTNAKVRALVEYVRMADRIAPDDPYIAAAVTALEGAGLIGPGRAAEVLA